MFHFYKIVHVVTQSLANSVQSIPKKLRKLVDSEVIAIKTGVTLFVVHSEYIANPQLTFVYSV